MSYVLNFQEAHSLEGIAHRTKTVTIRPKRKTVLGVGNQRWLTQGSRTGHYQRLARITITQESPVRIIGAEEIWVDGRLLSSAEIASLVLEDGEKDLTAFVEFFRKRYGLPFEGTLFRWTYE